jgi:hypothetical protein
MDAGEFSASGSGPFIYDVQCKELLRSIDMTAVIMINCCKRTHNYKIGYKKIQEEIFLNSTKEPHNITVLYLGLQNNI